MERYNRCKGCGAIIPENDKICSNCVSDMPSFKYGDEKKRKTIINIMIIVVIIILFILFIECLSDNDQDNKNTCPNKTWDNMTSRERKACQDTFKDNFESGKWKLNN